MLTADTPRQPYPGLRPFEADEADLFFGREEHVDALLARLSRSHVVAVVGESGAGKSSLVRAGLLPALEAGFVVEAGSDWRVALMRPGGSPLGALANALLAPGVLSEVGGQPRREFALAELRRGPLGLVQIVRDAHLDGQCNLLIVVDQFEELFRYCREPAQKDQASVFVELLLHASRQRQVPIFVVLTMRSDFVGDCARFRGLPETLNDNQYLTPRLTRDQIAQAIREPARVCGGVVEAALVDELCNAAGDDPDQLPLLQHLLMRTWTAAAEISRRPDVTPELSRRMGGLHSALNDHAQQIYQSLGGDGQQAIARAMFKSLTDPHSQRRDLRRDALVSEVAAMAGTGVDSVIAVADEFRADGRHMLMPSSAVPLSDHTRLDISHESLIRQWSALNEWAREESANAREFEKLGEEAQAERDGRGELLSGRNLARALDWIRHVEPTPAWAKRYSSASHLEATLAFIRKSEAEAERRRDQEAQAAARDAAARRSRYYTWFSCGALVLTAVVALVIFSLWRDARTERDVAEAQRLKAVDQSDRAEKQKDIAELERARAADQRRIALNETARATELSKTLASQNLALSQAGGLAHANQLIANARLEMTKDPALAVLLAREAAREAGSDRELSARAMQVLRSALAGHVPSVEAPFDVPRSRNYLPDSNKKLWLDYMLDRSTISGKDNLAIVPSGNDALIWSMTSRKVVHRLKGHAGIVGSAIFSPDGALAVTTSADHTARVWNVATETSLAALTHREMVNNAAFSRDGTLLVTLGDEGRALVWTVGRYESPRCTLVHKGNFVTASFSPDQQRLLTVTHSTYEWAAQIWDLSRDKCPPQAVPALEKIENLRWASFADREPWLGVVTVDGTTIILNTADWTEARKVSPDVLYTNNKTPDDVLPPPLAWSHDGRSFAMAGGDGTVYVAAIGKTDRPLALRGHSGTVTSISFQSTDTMLLTTSTDRTARLWRLTHDERLLERILLTGHRDAVGSGAFSPDGSEILTVGDDGKMRIWAPPEGVTERPLTNLRTAAYSPDGKHIALAGVPSTRSGFWMSEAAAATLKPHNDDVSSPGQPVVSFFGTAIVVGNRTHELTVRDVRTPAKIASLEEPGRAITVLSVSPAGRFLLASTSSGDKTDRASQEIAFKVWDLNGTPAQSVAIAAPSTASRNACLAKAIANDKRVAWYCADDEVVLIASAGRSTPVALHIEHGRTVKDVRFSTQGRWLAVAFEDFSIEVFESGTNTSKPRPALRGHNGPVTAMDFRMDDRLLVSVSVDRTARVWDVASNAEISANAAPAVPRLSGVTFSPDGLSLLLVAPDRLLSWRCYTCGDMPALLAEVRRRKIDRPLSKEEERLFGVTSSELNTDRLNGPGHAHGSGTHH